MQYYFNKLFMDKVKIDTRQQLQQQQFILCKKCKISNMLNKKKKKNLELN